MTPRDVRSYPGAPVYDLQVLRTVFLTFESDDWEPELADFYGTDVEVPATVTVDGKKYRDVGVHFRGNSSYRMVPAGYKQSLNLSFDFVDPAPAARRLQDAQPAQRERRSDVHAHSPVPHIARQYIPAPQANFVKVVINGESWGVYVKTCSSSTRSSSGNIRHHGRSAVEDAGQAGRRAGSSTWARTSTIQAELRDQVGGRARDWAALVELWRDAERDAAEQAAKTALAPMLDIDGALGSSRSTTP